MRPGLFITFEGVDGCGKTTQLRLLAAWLKQRGCEVVETVEPGGTPIGREIRKILLDPANGAMRPRTELLLYFASRAQNVEEVIGPARAAGRIVLSDRFTDSTLVYQGCGRGISPRTVLRLDRIACAGLRPDLTFLLDIDPAAGLARARRRNQRGITAESRIDDETLEFHERVRRGYLALAAREPERIKVIDAAAPVADVAARITAAVEPRV
jgi:dTMP kinase